MKHLIKQIYWTVVGKPFEIGTDMGGHFSGTKVFLKAKGEPDLVIDVSKEIKKHYESEVLFIYCPSHVEEWCLNNIDYRGRLIK